MCDVRPSNGPISDAEFDGGLVGQTETYARHRSQQRKDGLLLSRATGVEVLRSTEESRFDLPCHQPPAVDNVLLKATSLVFSQKYTELAFFTDWLATTLVIASIAKAAGANGRRATLAPKDRLCNRLKRRKLIGRGKIHQESDIKRSPTTCANQSGVSLFPRWM